jgi:hypothetical protein
MSSGKQPTWQTSESTVILLGVTFAWVILGMLYVSRLNVGAEAANRSGFDFAFHLFFAVFLSLSVLGTFIAARAWVLGVGRFTRDFAAYMVSGASFAILAGTTLTAFGIFPWVINVPMFFCLSVAILMLNWSWHRGFANS